VSAAVPARAYMSIGEVLARLRSDFPDVTISKIRFLEAEGLVEPQRTPSGYRKFTTEDLGRLQYVLAAQRDQYLPLKVIRDHLEAIDRGLQPPDSAGAGPRVPVAVVSEDGFPSSQFFGRDPSDLRLSRDELLESAGLDEELLTALESYGLISQRSDGAYYDGDALLIAKTASELSEFGIEPRHLRSFKAAADREVGLIEQVATPLMRQKSTEARARAEEAIKQLAALSVRLHASLVKAQLDPDLRR
jgi:DNA-binding transcriptional MerR regulator